MKVKLCLGPAPILGDTESTDGAGAAGGGDKVMILVAETELSAKLVALTSTVAGDVTSAGAVYNPFLEMKPTAGLIDQATPESPDPLNVAVNWMDCEGFKVAIAGVTVTVVTVM